MSEQVSTQVSTLQQPANDDKEALKAYWKAQGQSWRTEPEIDVERRASIVRQDHFEQISPPITS